MRSAQVQYLILRSDGEVVPSSRSFADVLRESGPDMEQFLFHEHYIWNSARLRVAYGTLEMRPACQQPWESHMAACGAWGWDWWRRRGRLWRMWRMRWATGTGNILREYHRRAIARGLLASEPAPDFLATIVTLAEQGLRERERGEERFLQPVRQRLLRRENPARRLRRAYRTEGLTGVLTRATIQPATIPAST